MIEELLDELSGVAYEALAEVGLPPELRGVYHGPPPSRRPCCPDDGAIHVYWSPAWVTDGAASWPASHTGNYDGVGDQAWVLHVRWWVCWPMRQDDQSFDLEGADRRARDLARGTEALLCALAAIACRADSALRTRCRTVQLGQAVPIGPSGGCAGVDLSVTVANPYGCTKTAS